MANQIGIIRKAFPEQKELYLNHLKWRRTPYTPPFRGSFTEITPRNDIGFPPFPVIVMGDKIIPHQIYRFLTPLHPLPGYHFLIVCVCAGGGRGVNTWLVCRLHCVSIPTQVPFHFFSLDANAGGPRCYLRFSKTSPLWGPTGEDFAIFRSAWVG